MMNNNHRKKKKRERIYPRGARGIPKRLCLFRKSKYMQRWFLRNPWIKPMLCFNLAAVKIQALARRYIVCHLGAKHWRKKISKKKKTQPTQLNRYLANLDYYSRSKGNKPEYLNGGFSTWCAVRIQAWWRMILKRRRYIYYVKDFYHIASIQIQNTWQNRAKKEESMEEGKKRMMRVGSANIPRTKVGHARAIQLAWRTHCSIRVYRYFRDLILNKLKGAPTDLLRCIIPGEADILDKASGVHVRFRLGGHIFPPKIYYKIFTHRPLCDVNAFAPRNYANESLFEPASLHVKPPRRDQPPYKGIKEKFEMSSTHLRVGGALYDATLDISRGTKDWYKREDHNYWRPISHEASDDPMFETPYKSMSRNESTFNSRKMKKSHYHFSRFKRQEDILRERKKKKREWMLKAYMFSAGNKGHGIGEDTPSKNTPVSSQIQRNFSPRGDRSTDPASPSQDNTSRSDDVSTGARNILISDSFSEGNTLDDLAPLPIKTAGIFNAQVRTNVVTEDEDLLKWSQALDFETYNSNWANMAVSMPSDFDYSDVYNATTVTSKKSLHVIVDH